MKNDMKPLFDLIPEIQKGFKPSGKPTGFALDNTTHVYLGEEFPDTMEKFVNIAVDLEIMLPDFDWMQWKEGERMMSSENYNYKRCDLLTLRKLITAIIRNEHFCNGYLVELWTSRKLIRLLLALEWRWKEENPPKVNWKKMHYQERLDKLMARGSAWPHRTLRTFLDPYAHEWEELELEDKIIYLEYILKVTGIPLKQWINEYRDFYLNDLYGKAYVIKAIPDAVEIYKNRGTDLIRKEIDL